MTSTSPGPMLRAARAVVATLGDRATTLDKPILSAYLVAAHALDARGSKAPAALYQRHDSAYARVLALAEERGVTSDPAESWSFPWEEGEEADDWRLIAPHDHFVQMESMSSERDAHLAALRALMVEPEAEVERRVDADLAAWQARHGVEPDAETTEAGSSG